MPLLLSDDTVRSVLTMDACIQSLESAYKQEGLGMAANRTKSTIYVRSSSGTAQYVSMEGGIRDLAAVAIRIRSHAGSPVGHAVGSVGAGVLMLFSAETGELLALFEQRLVSCYRVGATAALAAKHMAAKNAKVVGILGSGGMAHSHAIAYARVRKVERFKVHSPNPQSRSAFARWITEMTNVPADAMENAEAVVRGSDIVAACTDAKDPIVKGDWLNRKGLHMTAVQSGDRSELEREGLKRFDRLVTYMSGTSTHHNTEPGHRPFINATNEASLAPFSVIPRQHSLVDVLLGKAPGRESDDECNYFFSEGTGVQFAALTATAYRAAREQGVGEEMPEAWARWFRSNTGRRF